MRRTRLFGYKFLTVVVFAATGLEAGESLTYNAWKACVERVQPQAYVALAEMAGYFAPEPEKDHEELAKSLTDESLGYTWDSRHDKMRMHDQWRGRAESRAAQNSDKFDLNQFWLEQSNMEEERAVDSLTNGTATHASVASYYSRDACLIANMPGFSWPEWVQ